MNQPQEFVTLATYSQALEAHAARNFLQENGIQAFVTDEFNAIESWSNWVETKLQVATADAERARKLLAGRKSEQSGPATQL